MLLATDMGISHANTFSFKPGKSAHAFVPGFIGKSYGFVTEYVF
jgi:hypothetical protein